MNFTACLLLGIAIVLLIYDGVCGHFGLPTESSVIRNTAWVWNVLPLILGSIVGHWFFPGHGITKNSAFGNCIPLWAAMLVWDVFFHLSNSSTSIWYRYPGYWFLLWIPLGTLVCGAS